MAERSAKSIIIEFLSDSFLSFADNNSTAKEIFEKLDSIYERKSLATQLSVRKQLLTFKLNGDTPLIIHFNKFDELIFELMASMMPLMMMMIDELIFELMASVDKVAHLLLTILQATSLSNNKQKALHLKTKFKAKPSKNFKSNLKCHHCGKKGHFKKDCFIFKRGLENKDKEKHA